MHSLSRRWIYLLLLTSLTVITFQNCGSSFQVVESVSNQFPSNDDQGSNGDTTGGITEDGTSDGQGETGSTIDIGGEVISSNGAQPSSGIKQLAAGQFHTCALSYSGSIKCWGDNSFGQLGNGQKNPSPVSTPVDVVGVSTAVAISASASGTCAVLQNGHVKCWPLNDAIGGAPSIYEVSGIDNAWMVSVGEHVSCAGLIDGKIKCWGFNANGALGNGSTSTDSDNRTGTLVTETMNATDVAAGYSHVCGKFGGYVKCWGRNQSLELGVANLSNSTLPILNGVSDASALSSKMSNSCAVLTDGTIHCWGNSQSISQILGLGGSATAVAVGAQFACALLNDKTIKCWGRNDFGQLGSSTLPVSVNGSIPATVSTPSLVMGLANVRAVSAGFNHVCALLISGEVFCWGDNGRGQLGNASVGTDTTPQPVDTYVRGSKTPVAVQGLQ